MHTWLLADDQQSWENVHCCHELLLWLSRGLTAPSLAVSCHFFCLVASKRFGKLSPIFSSSSQSVFLCMQVCEILTTALFSPEGTLTEEAQHTISRLLAFATSAEDSRSEFILRCNKLDLTLLCGEKVRVSCAVL